MSAHRKEEEKKKKKKAAVAFFALIAVGVGGFAVSGAYFTDQKTIAGNTLQAGTVQLGGIGDTASTTTPLSFTNILPMTDAVATDATTPQAVVATVNIRNTGTASIDWSALITVPAAGEAAFANALSAQYRVGAGAWSATSTLASLASAPIASTGALAGTNGTQTIDIRLWLPAATNNTFQAKTLSFDLRARAIQAGAPALDRNADSSYTPLYVP